jgi:hypothetical protein
MRHRLVICLALFAFSSVVTGAELDVPVTYDLKVPVEPGTGTVAVRGIIVVPVMRLPPGADQAGTVHIAIAYRGRMEIVPEWGTSDNQPRGMDDQINTRLVRLASCDFCPETRIPLDSNILLSKSGCTFQH